MSAEPVRIRRDAKANPTIEDWESEYGGFNNWNKNWKIWNTYENSNPNIERIILSTAYHCLNKTLQYLPKNLPNTERYIILQQQINSWKEEVAQYSDI
jgi:hypothetical protein